MSGVDSSRCGVCGVVHGAPFEGMTVERLKWMAKEHGYDLVEDAAVGTVAVQFSFWRLLAWIEGDVIARVEWLEPEPDPDWHGGMARARHGRHRYLCHLCDWVWLVHFWLPFDFELARAAHRRHMRRAHGMRCVEGRWVLR